MSQTKKGQVISVKDKPFSNIEIEQLKTILRSPLIRRPEMKNVFITNYKRAKKDVDNWLYRNSPNSAQGKRAAADKFDNYFPKEKASEPVGRQDDTNIIRLPAGATLEIPFKKFRIEGSSIIFEF